MANVLESELGPLYAVKWIFKAAMLGDSTAELRLGQMFLEGRGLTQDAKEGEKWLTRSAVQGNREAIYMLEKGPVETVSLSVSEGGASSSSSASSLSHSTASASSAERGASSSLPLSAAPGIAHTHSSLFHAYEETESLVQEPVRSVKQKVELGGPITLLDRTSAFFHHPTTGASGRNVRPKIEPKEAAESVLPCFNF